MRVLERVFMETINRESLLCGESKVTAAVSGGADSVAMLHLLNRFASSRGWCIDVLHINHRLRPDSDRDELFVSRLAEQMGLPFRSVHPESDQSGSMESRWSSIRQRVYNQQPGIVALAHSASDRAETVLLRLFEGSGLRGLGGMDYKGLGPVQRPLLDMQNTEIRNWLKEKNYEWIEDSSNRNTDISRNKLRLAVMPVLQQNFPEAIPGICRSGALLSRWRDLQDQLGMMSEGNSVTRKELLEIPCVLGALTLWQMAGRPRSGFEEFTKTMDWLSRGGNGTHLLPGGKRLVAEDELITVEIRGPGRF